MNNVHFRSNGFIICKRTDRVDCGMDNNTRKQASAAIKDRDRQEADRDGEGDLAKIADKIHTAAVKQKPAEDNLLQEPDTEHTQNAANRFRRLVINGGPVPKEKSARLKLFPGSTKRRQHKYCAALLLMKPFPQKGFFQCFLKY